MEVEKQILIDLVEMSERTMLFFEAEMKNHLNSDGFIKPNYEGLYGTAKGRYEQARYTLEEIKIKAKIHGVSLK